MMSFVGNSSQPSSYLTILSSLDQNPGSQNETENSHEYEGLDYNTGSETGAYEVYEIPIPDFIVKEKRGWEASVSLPDMREKAMDDYHKMIMRVKTI